MVQTGSKKWSKRGQNLGPKKCPERGQKSDQNGVKIWSKRGQISTPETDDQKLGSRNDIRGRLQTKTPTHPHHKPQRISCFLFFCGLLFVGAWWVCGKLLVVFGERNCSVAKIVGRNPDDSGQYSKPKNNNASLQSNN